MMVVGRRKDVEPEVYRDDSLSVGGNIKKDGVVLQRRRLLVRKKLNVNCRVESFCRIINGLDSYKKRLVAEMGFDCLFDLVGISMPRTLCYWLATRVDVFGRSLITSDRIVLPLSKVQIRNVIGLLMGSKAVPTEVVDEDMALVTDCIWDLYSTTFRGGTTGISRSTIVEVVKGPVEDDEQFKTSFLMLALTDVLCPTTSSRFPVSLLPALTVAANASHYDWCSLVLEDIFRAVRNFGKRFYPDGVALGCGGCTLFLLVFYLDHLKKLPPLWGSFPRIKAWTTKEINIIMKADQLHSGDYGRLGCIDVAYGEKHPLEARDVDCVGVRGFQGSLDLTHNQQDLPLDTAVDVAGDLKCNNYGQVGGGRPQTSSSSAVNTLLQLDSVVKGVVHNFTDDYTDPGFVSTPLSNSNWPPQLQRSFGTVLNPLLCGSYNLSHPPPLAGQLIPPHEGARSSSIDQQDCSGGYTPPANISGQIQTSNNDNIVADDACLERSRVHRKLKSSVKLSDDYLSTWRPRSNFVYKRKLPALLRSAAESLYDRVIFKCGDNSTTLRRCLTTLNGCVEEEYVRVACSMYEKVWAERHTGRSRRLMMDPSFAHHVLHNDCTATTDMLLTSFRSPDVSALTATDKINMIVVPVLEGGYWWAVIFSLNRSEALVIDSMESTNAVDIHHLSLINLMQGLDQVLNHFDSNWEVGRVAAFEKSSMELECDAESANSGIHMLIAVKQLEDRFKTRIKTVEKTMQDAREWLLVEDLMSKKNEVITELESLFVCTSGDAQ